MSEASDVLGGIVQACNTGLLLIVVGELRVVIRRQRKIAARVGVVERANGIEPPPDSGPHPTVSRF